MKSYCQITYMLIAIKFIDWFFIFGWVRKMKNLGISFKIFIIILLKGQGMKSFETQNTTNPIKFENKMQLFVIQSITGTLKFPNAIRTYVLLL